MSILNALVEEAMAVAAAKTFDRTVHGCVFDIVDRSDIGELKHFHVSVTGEHTEASPSGKFGVVKNDLLSLKRVVWFQEHLAAYLKKHECELVALTIIFLEKQRRFGFSIIMEKKG